VALATSYNAAGNREQITDDLTVLEPEETPILSMAKKSKATATFIEWQADDLDTPAFAGVSEGADVNSFDNKAANRAKLGNYVQKFRRTWQVSDIQQLVATAGVPSEIARSEAKCVRELKRDIESAIASDQDRQQETGAVTPYKLRGLGDWIDASGPSDVPAAYRTPSASIDSTAMGSFTEDTLQGVLQGRYEQVGSAGDNLYLVAGPTLKRTITDFARASDTTYRVTEDANDKKITLNVMQYEGDYGVVYIVPSLFNGRTSGSGIDATVRHRGYLLTNDLIEVPILKAESSQRLENQGGGERGFCDAVLSLCVKNPLGLGAFKATS
jgi:hypothetical protein